MARAALRGPGLHRAGLAVVAAADLCVHLSAAVNPVMDRIIRDGRLRFGKTELFSREESARPSCAACARGCGLANLPDMDFGPKDSAFVPFFGVEACTFAGPRPAWPAP